MKVLSLEPSKINHMYFIHAFLMTSKLSTRTELNKEIKKKGRDPCGVVRLTGRGPCVAGPPCTQPWWASC